MLLVTEMPQDFCIILHLTELLKDLPFCVNGKGPSRDIIAQKVT